MSRSDIELSGVRVNNLRSVSLRIKRNALTVICGVSGSGKSSLAFDTLYAEGQRRYIDTFSPSARQFLAQLERPDADHIDGIPPAIAIRQNAVTSRQSSTVGNRTEIAGYLRLLFANFGHIVCPNCRQNVQSYSVDALVNQLLENASGLRAMLAFESPRNADEKAQEHCDRLILNGFTRIVFQHSTVRLSELQNFDELPSSLIVISDRVRISDSDSNRIRESLETCYREGDGTCRILVEQDSDTPVFVSAQSLTETIDGKRWQSLTFNQKPVCLSCNRQFPEITVDLLNDQSALGACKSCEGFGQSSSMTFERIVPDQSLSLESGAIAPWTTKAYRHELDELLALAGDYDIPADIPFSELSSQARQLIYDGVPERNFGGVRGFHAWLVRHRYKKSVSAFLNRWRSWETCPECQGTRLNTDAEAIHLNGTTFIDAQRKEIDELQHWVTESLTTISPNEYETLEPTIRQLNDRLRFMQECGIGYLSLNRSLNTLSGGEAQRVALTRVLGSGLVNTLYVLDEPTSGLNAKDTKRVIQSARRLQRAGNTVVVVEHDPDFIQQADEVVEIGPGAGANGGQIVFQGTPNELRNVAETITANSLRHFADEKCPAGQSLDEPENSRAPEHWIDLKGIRCHNLLDVNVNIPLDVICAVSGVSGSGKSSLICHVLYPELASRKRVHFDRDQSKASLAGMTGAEHIDSVELLDRSTLVRSHRSIPATYINAFDSIRKLFSETHEARKRNLSPGAFSFNSARGGRCEACEGRGFLTIEMQFLADIQATCETCRGRRFREDILEVRYRGLSIHEILEMTADEAFTFFNGHSKLQRTLNGLKQAGLGYIRLGQSTLSLSGGESQRLRIAALLAGEGVQADREVIRPKGPKKTGQRTLFILDEPSTGLHLADVENLMNALSHLVQIGHSVIVIDHNPGVIARADYIIELGPGAGREGGRIVRSERV